TKSIDRQKLGVDEIYGATLIPTISAWIYPIEPPRSLTQYAKLVANIRSSSQNTGVFADKIYPLPADLKEVVKRIVPLQLIPEN
ncbi:hypothetical protein PENTCL1PPCAC_16899, partial [Pristionchus entomophagus]